MNNLRRILLKPQRFLRHFSADIYEPTYLDALKPKYPLYDALNIQIRGYDFALLESYQSLIHTIARNMDLEVEDSWAIPAQEMQITTYKPNSEVINSVYKLKQYERSVQVTDISTLQVPILIRALEACTPAGVSLDIVPHEEYHEEVRYIPDKDLLTLKEELDEMGGPRKTK